MAVNARCKHRPMPESFSFSREATLSSWHCAVSTRLHKGRCWQQGLAIRHNQKSDRHQFVRTCSHVTTAFDISLFLTVSLAVKDVAILAAASAYFLSAENAQASARSWKSNWLCFPLCFGAQPVGQPRPEALLQLLALTSSLRQTCISNLFCKVGIHRFADARFACLLQAAYYVPKATEMSKCRAKAQLPVHGTAERELYDLVWLCSLVPTSVGIPTVASMCFQSSENVQAAAISWKSNLDCFTLCYGGFVAQPVGQPRQAALFQLLALRAL